MLQMIEFFTAPPPELSYPVPQLRNGYCPLSDFDGDALTRSNAV
jgi:hypothetical protein